ncbi:MAG: hypothetical protein OQK25_00975 [Gammaproteobacteria bacterium]|nr:hypothetical protein [Gammaproteobacteria bacterium]
MKHHKASHLFTLFMMMLLSPLTTIAGELLSGDEIEALFSNRTFEGIHLKNGWTFKNYAGSDGGCNVLFLSGKKRIRSVYTAGM